MFGRIFNKNLTAVHLLHTLLKLDKPIYVGMAILDLSKTLMYDFHYNYMKPKYGDNLKLLFTDTDSLCYHVFTPDIYQVNSLYNSFMSISLSFLYKYLWVFPYHSFINIYTPKLLEFQGVNLVSLTTIVGSFHTSVFILSLEVFILSLEAGILSYATFQYLVIALCFRIWREMLSISIPATILQTIFYTQKQTRKSWGRWRMKQLVLLSRNLWD